MALLAEYLQCGPALNGWAEYIIPPDLASGKFITKSSPANFNKIPQMLVVSSVFRHKKMFYMVTKFCLLNLAVSKEVQEPPEEGMKVIYYQEFGDFPFKAVEVAISSEGFPGKILSKLDVFRGMYC